MAKMGGAHRGKNGWSLPWQELVELVLYTPWQKWVELTVAKISGNGVIDIAAQNWWDSPWQKWVELAVAKMGGAVLVWGTLRVPPSIGGRGAAKSGLSATAVYPPYQRGDS